MLSDLQDLVGTLSFKMRQWSTSKRLHLLEGLLLHCQMYIQAAGSMRSLCSHSCSSALQNRFLDTRAVSNCNTRIRTSSFSRQWFLPRRKGCILGRGPVSGSLRRWHTLAGIHSTISQLVRGSTQEGVQYRGSQRNAPPSKTTATVSLQTWCRPLFLSRLSCANSHDLSLVFPAKATCDWDSSSLRGNRYRGHILVRHQTRTWCRLASSKTSESRRICRTPSLALYLTLLEHLMPELALQWVRGQELVCSSEIITSSKFS